MSDDNEFRTKVAKTSTSDVAAVKAEKSLAAVVPVVPIPETVGEVMCQGINDFGQLGVSKEKRKYPFPVDGLKDKDIVAVEAGLLHSMCLTKEGVLYSCGQNDEGVLGRVGKDDAEREYMAVDTKNFVAPIARVTAGASHSVCIDTLGNLYVWGCYRNIGGLFGKTGGSKDHLLGPDVPKMVRECGKVKQVASGLHHTAAITITNKVVTWGVGEAGQLGRGGERVISRGNRAENSQLIPRTVSLPLSKVQKKEKVVPVQLSCGGYHTMCVMSDGSVFGWGLNNCGQLGAELSTTEEDEVEEGKLENVTHIPTRVESLSHLKIVQVACGEQHTVVLTKEGHVYAFGRNSFHQLGRGDPEDAKELEEPMCEPVRALGALKDVKVASITSNYHITFCIDTNGVVYSWGMGSTKALAGPPEFEEEEDVVLPTKMHGGRLDKRRVLQLSCGSMHAVTLVAPASDA